MNRFIAVFLFLLTFQVWAESPTSNTSAVLGTGLTPIGAEVAGNGFDIPAWTGGLAVRNDHQSGQFHSNPFANDAPLLRISAANFAQHQTRLTEGQIALLKANPDMYLAVYPTRRSASYPPYVYDAVSNNASKAELIKYGSGVRNATMSSPFPQPQNGLEVLWNHTLRFRGHSSAYQAVASAVNEDGQRMDTLRNYQYFFKYSILNATQDDIDNRIFLLKYRTLAPAKVAGAMSLVHETLDQIRSPRKSWVYTPGQRRLRRTPDLGYDTADPNTNSIRTIDQVDMFNGAPDYYDWTLLAKREIYIPYNAYLLDSGELTIDDIVGPKHLNPELLRYEAHRVWVVEANIRVGYRHRYHKRRYYFDEDSWAIIYAEEFDENGQLWQVSEAHVINYYEVPLVYSTLEVTYDLQNSRYYVEGLDNERGGTMDFSRELKERDFSPAAVRRESRR